ncbi:PadR family transcriptional regulator [Sphaerisporangium fuscum]|uniref:PadR family transcriptional regulator n=1 Tax=Sphaerisporangium fuscum TaxID=2835868 RepID=UPI001BDD9045|nr:PadR family transcriptional regulator [Sphaerisporangium fuscum]
MSATRLLVLGVVRLHGQAHGYLVGSELESWEAGQWAGLRSGSIYHALRQLAKEGLLDTSEVHEWPGRVDYAINEKGEAEFLGLLRSALRVPDRRPELLNAALVLLPALPEEEVISLLKERVRTLEDERAQIVATAQEGRRPRHVTELFALRAAQAAGEAAWVRDLIGRLERGEEPA